jgi:hypothetical protein
MLVAVTVTYLEMTSPDQRVPRAVPLTASRRGGCGCTPARSTIPSRNVARRPAPQMRSAASRTKAAAQRDHSGDGLWLGMSVLVSTDHLPAAARFDYWRDVLSQLQQEPVELGSDHAGDFWGEMRSTHAGAVEFAVITARRLLRRLHDPEAAALAAVTLLLGRPDPVELAAGEVCVDRDARRVTLANGRTVRCPSTPVGCCAAGRAGRCCRRRGRLTSPRPISRCGWRPPAGTRAWHCWARLAHPSRRWPGIFGPIPVPTCWNGSPNHDGDRIDTALPQALGPSPPGQGRSDSRPPCRTPRALTSTVRRH